MGTYYLAIGSVEFVEDTPVSAMEGVEQLFSNQKDIFNVHFDREGCAIDFQMEGTNGVDYDPLDELLPQIRAITNEFAIQTTEFACAEEGYFFDNTDEECLEQWGFPNK